MLQAGTGLKGCRPGVAGVENIELTLERFEGHKDISGETSNR